MDLNNTDKQVIPVLIHSELENVEARKIHYKKQKTDDSQNYVLMLLDVISNLSAEQKSIVHDLGFSSVLDLCCDHIPFDLLLWLLQYFNPDTRKLSLPSGFTFTLNANCVEKILGIPNGGLSVLNRATKESYEFIMASISCQGPTPTVRELCNLITPDLLGADFARVFMLLILSSFLCPNTRGVCSTRYFHALTYIPGIRKLDWCSFVLDWLVSYINKYQFKKQSNSEGNFHKALIGGCCHVIVISYLEFLSTNAFNLRLDCPRIHVWSNTIVNALTLLDSNPNLEACFGQLQLKHICCTPFRNCFSIDNCCQSLMNRVEDIVKHCSPTMPQEFVLNLMAELVCKLKASVSLESLPSVCSSLHNVISALYPAVNSHYSSTTFLYDTDSDEEESNTIALRKISAKHDKLSNEEFELLMKYFPIFSVPNIECAPKHSFSPFHNCKLEEIQEEDPYDLDFPGPNASFEALLCETADIDDECKRYLQIDDEGDDPAPLDLFALASQGSTPIAELFSPAILSIGMNLSDIVKSSSAAIVQQVKNVDESRTTVPLPVSHTETESHANIPRQNCYFGLSLNERANLVQRSEITKTVSPASTVDHNFPNFDILGDLDAQLNEDKYIDSSLLNSLKRGFHKCSDLINDEGQNVCQQHAPSDANSANVQLIFTSEIEDKLYHLVTDNIVRETRSRFIHIGSSWVDKFKISLSMMKGGWIHFHVMDCFCQMLAANQKMVSYLDGHIYMQYFDHSTATLLMNSTIDCNFYKANFLENCGFQLHNAALLHIPCFINNQWILVVVNFRENSFQILDSDHNINLAKSAADTVVSNFRKFFVRCFPSSVSYNIYEFPVKYLDVPKHNFRYDSGIFVIQFMQSFDGTSMERFSNLDVVALRAKFLFQLATSKHNKAKSTFMQQFYADSTMVSVDGTSSHVHRNITFFIYNIIR
ncbi:unnamed protein product [Urochloa decumbens]|uniref:Ubiquitin-like protease family profile domain-containing protein n=1 Tax=Urochloa decumbens TaxID=240449 RepID=A0ABC9ELV6_9POAL